MVYMHCWRPFRCVIAPFGRRKLSCDSNSLLPRSQCFMPDPVYNVSSRSYSEGNESSVLDLTLRSALLRRLCSPERPLAAKCVYRQLVNPCRLVKELNFSKTSRRLARQHVVLRFLRKHNVLMHSLLFYIPETATWNTTSEFRRLVLYGNSILRSEVQGRLLRLFPDIPSQFFAQCLQSLVSEDSLAELFDALHMKHIVGLRPPKGFVSEQDSLPQAVQRTKPSKVSLSKVQKKHMLCAVLAEMQWFALRTKATDRTHNNALFPPSDVLILHVLCMHQLESIPAELVFRKVECHLTEIRKVWVNEPMSLPTQLSLVPRTSSALSLACNAHAPTMEEREHRMRASDAIPQINSMSKVDSRGAVVKLRPLTPEPDTNYVKSFMKVNCRYTRFQANSFKVLPTDRKGESPLISIKKVTQEAKSVGGPLLTEARRHELLSGLFECE